MALNATQRGQLTAAYDAWLRDTDPGRAAVTNNTPAADRVTGFLEWMRGDSVPAAHSTARETITRESTAAAGEVMTTLNNQAASGGGTSFFGRNMWTMIATGAGLIGSWALGLGPIMSTLLSLAGVAIGGLMDSANGGLIAQGIETIFPGALPRVRENIPFLPGAQGAQLTNLAPLPSADLIARPLLENMELRASPQRPASGVNTTHSTTAISHGGRTIELLGNMTSGNTFTATHMRIRCEGYSNQELIVPIPLTEQSRFSYEVRRSSPSGETADPAGRLTINMQQDGRMQRVIDRANQGLIEQRLRVQNNPNIPMQIVVREATTTGTTLTINGTVGQGQPPTQLQIMGTRSADNRTLTIDLVTVNGQGVNLGDTPIVVNLPEDDLTQAAIQQTFARALSSNTAFTEKLRRHGQLPANISTPLFALGELPSPAFPRDTGIGGISPA